jgi:hypothetical protein
MIKGESGHCEHYTFPDLENSLDLLFLCSLEYTKF